MFHSAPASIRSGVAAALLAGLTLASGCGKAHPDRPAVYRASGVVTLNGNPVEGVLVNYQSTTDANRVAYATTDSAGKFALTTFETGDGAVAGDHVIKLMKVEATPATTAAVPPGAPGRRTPPPKSLIPKKYTDYKTSELKATVNTSGTNSATFELKE